jgi:RND family efflux transporter MFP subunit
MSPKSHEPCGFVSRFDVRGLLRVSFLTDGRWIGVTIAAISLCGCGRQIQLPPSPPVKVTVAKPVEQEVVDYAEFTGNTAAVNTVSIRARVSGYLEKIEFKEGAHVKANDVLFEIDPRPYQAALDQAQANLEQSQAQLILADSEFQRAESLRKSAVMAAQDYDTKLATRDQAKASVLANQALLETAKLNLEFAEVRSPIDGRTSTYRYAVGNFILGGDTSSAGELTTVVSVDPIYVYFNVDERSLLALQEMIREGKMAYSENAKQPIEMKLANETGFIHNGFIDFVDNQVDPSTGTVRARGVFPNKDGFMRPGLYVQVRIPSSPKYKALLISDLAIGYDQGQQIVYVVGGDNVAMAKRVKLGDLAEGLRVVKEGVGANDQVVVDGIVYLRPGVAVMPEEANMVDFAGGIRRQAYVTPAGGSLGHSGSGAATPESRGPNSEPPKTRNQTGSGER